MKAGLKAIYCSGWQVACDANTAGDVYPDQSLYPANAVPELVRKLNKVCTRLPTHKGASPGSAVQPDTAQPVRFTPLLLNYC